MDANVPMRQHYMQNSIGSLNAHRYAMPRDSAISSKMDPLDNVVTIQLRLSKTLNSGGYLWIVGPTGFTVQTNCEASVLLMENQQDEYSIKKFRGNLFFKKISRKFPRDDPKGQMNNNEVTVVGDEHDDVNDIHIDFTMYIMYFFILFKRPILLLLIHVFY
jgi:hypothetical protein